MEKKPLGEQELDLLKYLMDSAPISVTDATAGYGKPRNLARTTVLTMMERLRTKGYLVRKDVKGTNLYSPSVTEKELFGGIVRKFVDKTLGGSLSPLVAYLADAQLDRGQIDDLKRLLDDMGHEGEQEPEGDSK